MLEIQRTICRQPITGLNQFDFSRAMPTPNLRTGMLGERDWGESSQSSAAL